MHAGFDRLDGLLKITMWKIGIRGISSRWQDIDSRKAFLRMSEYSERTSIYCNPEDMEMQNENPNLSQWSELYVQD